MDSGQEDVTLKATMEKDGPGQKGRFKGGRGGFSHRGRSQGRSSTKDFPIEEDPKEEAQQRSHHKEAQVSSKAEDKDKDQCHHCHQGGHFATECPEKSKGQLQKSSEGKKFEDYTYAYGGAEDPQLFMATALPQAYEEALTTMQQFLKNQDPLHGLNM